MSAKTTAAGWIEKLTGSLEQKKQYKQSVARMDALPEPYRGAARAYQRYFMYYGGYLDGDTLVTMVGDLADLWDRAATDATPVREIVGADPVEFGESFVQAYAGRQWIDKERQRLTTSIDAAIDGAEPGASGS
jgi:DNA-binding ferritin-like protein (Dps family)